MFHIPGHQYEHDHRGLSPCPQDEISMRKRNHRIDHLIYVLIEELLPYYVTKHKRQDFGFEGLNIEVRKHKDIISKSQSVTLNDIKV